MNDCDEREVEELLGRVAQGDPTATDALLNRYRQRLKQMVNVRMDERLAQRIDDSDVVQETLGEAYRRLPDYVRQRPIAFYPWLRAIAWNRLVDLHRRHLVSQKRSIRRELADPAQSCVSQGSLQGLVDMLVGRDATPSEHVMRRERAKSVKAALLKLSEQDREIVIMRHLEQLSVREVAEALEIPQGTVKSRHFRALRQLQGILSKHDDLPE